MTASIQVILDGAPIGKGRPRFSFRSKFPRAYTPAKTRSYEARLRGAAIKAMGSRKPFDGAMWVTVNAWLPIPASWSAIKRRRALSGDIRPTGRPDIDNIVKAACDALNGIVWTDDSRITELSVYKSYSDLPSLVINAHPARTTGKGA